MLKFTLALLTMGALGAASAQSPVAPAAPLTPEKQALVQRVLAKMPMDGVGVAMLQAPVAESLRQARSLLQGRVTPDKQEAAMKDINGDALKFLEEATPLVRASVQAEIGASVAPLLAQRFSDEELRQLAALLESPVKAKFEALLPALQNALGQKVGAATAAQINPRLADLQQRIGLRMRSAITP